MFIYLKNKATERSYHLWSTPQMPVTFKVVPGQTQEPRTTRGSPTRVLGLQPLSHYLLPPSTDEQEAGNAESRLVSRHSSMSCAPPGPHLGLTPNTLLNNNIHQQNCSTIFGRIVASHSSKLLESSMWEGQALILSSAFQLLPVQTLRGSR